MNKICKILITFVFLLALFAIGFLYYLRIQEESMGPVSFESFEKQEIDGRVFIQNKDVGLKFEVPEGWESGYFSEWVSLSIKSKDFTSFKENSPIPQKGCWIDIDIKKEKPNSSYDLEYSNLKELINDKNYLSNQNTDDKKFQLFYIDGHIGIEKNLIINSDNNIGKYIVVSVPFEEKVYSFGSHIFGQDQEKCIDYFKKFLESISIKK